MNAAEPTSYSQVDPILNVWADANRLRVFTKHDGRETRAVRLRNRSGDSTVICITPDPTSRLVKVDVESSDGVARRVFGWRPAPHQHSATVALEDLAVTLGDLVRAMEYCVFQPSSFATGGERLSAFLLDLFIIAAVESALLHLIHRMGWEGPLSALSFWIYILYSTIFEASPFRATPGKWTVGFQVAMVDGRPASWWSCLLRNAARILSLVPFGVGYLSIDRDRLGRALHDKLSGCVLVRRGAEFPFPPWKPNSREVELNAHTPAALL